MQVLPAVTFVTSFSAFHVYPLRTLVTINKPVAIKARISWFGLVMCASAISLSAQVHSDPGTAGPQSNLRTQDTKPGATANPPADAASAAPDLAPPPKRMFGVIPGFETTNDIPAIRRPLTVSEKYELSLHQAFDVSAHLENALQSAVEQAGNTQPHFGQGWGAYQKRFAAAEGDQITGSILSYGLLPSILHQDPRYFRQGRGSAMARIWYAVNRTFVTREDSGAPGFNTSQTLGRLISCGISTSYYPSRDRTLGYVFSNWGIKLAGNGGYNVLSEFYPDFKRVFFHHHKHPAQ